MLSGSRFSISFSAIFAVEKLHAMDTNLPAFVRSSPSRHGETERMIIYSI
jgi:hypothetical protein